MKRIFKRSKPRIQPIRRKKEEEVLGDSFGLLHILAWMS